MNYLITGGEGFIGSKIVQKVGGVSYDIKSGLDVLDSEKIKETAVKFDGIFHCAALISVPESIEKPDEYYRTNVEGTRSVIESAQLNKTKIVFSSSAAVYGDSSTRVSETNVLSPKSPYAENKRDGEELLRSSGLPAVVLRYFNVYGPGQSPQYAGVITAFILNALKNEDLVIYGNGSAVRDFIFVDDVVNANIKAMEYKNEKFEIFNIGSGREITVTSLAENIIKLVGATSKIKYLPARPGDIVYSQADVSKAKEVLGWRAEVSLEEGLKKTIEYYRGK